MFGLMDLAVIKRIFKRACPLLGLCNLLHLYLLSDKSIFFEIGIERSPAQGCNQWRIRDDQSAS